MTSGPDQAAHARNQARMLNCPGRVKQLRRDCTDLTVFQRLDEILNPIALDAFDVVIKENEPRAAGDFRAPVALLGKIKALIVA
ncbi:MAG: hypothetical protein ACREF8_00040, partial [Chthoniobacterales bacterium]